MYPGVELRVMRYIVAVARELHFGRAADRVHIAQPSLSKQIRVAEQELGFNLFHRHRSGVEVSSPGTVFIENAEQALRYAERAVALSRAAAAAEQGKLLLGVSPVIRQELFFRTRSAYHKQYPDVEICLSGQFSGQQTEMIMRNELHAGLIELPIRHRGLSVINLIQEPLAVALASTDPLAREGVLGLKALEGRVTAMISPDTDLSNKVVEEFLTHVRFPLSRVLRLPTMDQVMDYILHENGVGIVRDHAKRWQTDAIALRPLVGLPAIYTGLAYRRDNRSPLVRNLARLVRQIFALERQRMVG